MLLRSYGVFGNPPGASDQGLRGRSVKYGAAEDPRTLGKRMSGIDLHGFGGNAECLCADPEMSGGFGEI